MQKSKGGLGRGLGSLLSSTSMMTPQAPSVSAEDAPVIGSVLTATDARSDFAPEPLEIVDAGGFVTREISPAQITENPRQPRRHFRPEDLLELEASIKEHGILQPLLVSELSPGRYELIAGERRLRASRSLGLEKIPVVVRPLEDDQKKLELALIENIQRADLNAVEEAQAYKMLIDDFGLRQEDVAKQVGKSRPAVANALRLLELDEEMLTAIVEGRLMRSHARTLLAEPDLNRRKTLFDAMVTGGMTVREAEARAGARTRISKSKDPNIAALEVELRDRLGTKVKIDAQGATGKIEIHFYSKEDLKNLIERLSKA